MSDVIPDEADMETAMSVLLWMHGQSTDGALRDEISHVRYELDELLEAGVR